MRRQTLFSCPNVSSYKTFSAAPSNGRAMRAPTPGMDIFRAIAIESKPDLQCRKFTSRCHFDQVERSGTRGEISSELSRGFLTERFLDYSLREFGLRRPLEMTYFGNVLTKTLNSQLKKKERAMKKSRLKTPFTICIILVLVCMGVFTARLVD